LIQWDTETRVLLALYKLDSGDALFSTVKEIAKAAKLGTTTVREHLQRLHYTRRLLEFTQGRGAFGQPSTSWRLNQEGYERAAQLKQLKPNQRLVFTTLRKFGQPARYPTIGKKAGLNMNGVSQTLGALVERGLIRHEGDGRYVA
jgi:predicted ArsR family transcriptional regulator